MPQPDVLGRNGTYVALRKLRRMWRRGGGTCATHAPAPQDEELLAAKMIGRWPQRRAAGPRPGPR